MVTLLLLIMVKMRHHWQLPLSRWGKDISNLPRASQHLLQLYSYNRDLFDMQVAFTAGALVLGSDVILHLNVGIYLPTYALR